MNTVQIRGKGTLTFPAKLRAKYKIAEGEVFTIIDLGSGSFLFRPQVLQVDRLSNQIAKALKEANVTLDDLLQGLDEERKIYYQEKYGPK